MNVEQALYERLAEYTNLTALVSTRIYPVKLAQEPTMPAVTYQRVSGVRDMEFGGASPFAHPVFQVAAWGSTYASVVAVAAQIRAALNGYAGEMGGTGGVQSSVRIVNEIDLPDPDTGWHRIIGDYEIWHTE